MTTCFMCDKAITRNDDGEPFMTLSLPLIGHIAICSQRCADAMLSLPAQPRALLTNDGMSEGSLWLERVGGQWLADTGSDVLARRLALGWNMLRGYSDRLIERMTEQLKKEGK